MDAAAALRAKFRSSKYRAEYTSADSIEGMVDPDRARIRVYTTHSTHKTLTSLRQGSMIHVYDEDFQQKSADSFREAYMTHTSTSPNYQIVASLDAGRRQVELEGFEMVEQTIGLAMTLRQRISENADFARFFSVLRPEHMIPEEHRRSGTEFYYDSERGWGPLEEAYFSDEFVLDPTRVTLNVGQSGIDGDTFRHLLMDKFDIQINKTSRNTLLFMPNIGTTRGDIAYLIDVLVQISSEVADRLSLESNAGVDRHRAKVRSLTEGPPLPNFSRFHDAFKPDDTGTAEGDIRRAYFLAYDDANIATSALDRALLGEIRDGREPVSAAFVTPYPPGFPVLVPGQVLSAEIIEYLLELDVKEIHGYDSEKGLRLFTDAALTRPDHHTEPHAEVERG